MTILGDIAKRLQTDIADTQRAIIDPKFSQQLTTQRFENERYQRNRKDKLEDAATARKQQLEDEARANRMKFQTLLLTEQYQKHSKKGELWRIAPLVNNPNVDPDVQSLFRSVIEADESAPSLEMMDMQYKWAKQAHDMNMDFFKFRQQSEKMDQDQRNFMLDFYTKQANREYDRATKLQEQLAKAGSAVDVRRYFESLPDDDQYKRRMLTMLDGGEYTQEHAHKVLDHYKQLKLEEVRQIGKDRRAETMAKMGTAVSATRAEKATAATHLMSLNEQGQFPLWDNMSVRQRAGMINYVANESKRIMRDEGLDENDLRNYSIAVERATKKAMIGVSDNGAGWLEKLVSDPVTFENPDGLF